MRWPLTGYMRYSRGRVFGALVPPVPAHRLRKVKKSLQAKTRSMPPARASGRTLLGPERVVIVVATVAPLLRRLAPPVPQARVRRHASVLALGVQER
eukprot:COSAG04_NODE_20978_length_382_cov_0.872792_1_plen_96_part_10